VETRAILERTTTFPEVHIQQVQIGWRDLADAYRGRPMDPRAAHRTAQAADKLARELTAKLAANPDEIDALARRYSEEPRRGARYTISETSDFLPELEQLAQRLLPREVGVVKTRLGYHIVVRVDE
jgi:PPIC-type PPIASE domain